MLEINAEIEGKLPLTTNGSQKTKDLDVNRARNHNSISKNKMASTFSGKISYHHQPVNIRQHNVSCTGQQSRIDFMKQDRLSQSSLMLYLDPVME